MDADYRGCGRRRGHARASSGRGRGGRNRSYSGESSTAGSNGRRRGRGRGGRSWNFSTIRRVELENLFNVSNVETAVPMVDRRSTQSSLRLRSQLKGTEEWERVCVIYTSLLLGLPTTDQCTVPPLLQPLFRCLERSRLEGVNVFSNGAGKLLVYNLLSLRM